MPRSFYLIAIGGTAMTPLAALLVEKGERVLGSDLPLYPPMSDRLAALGFSPNTGVALRGPALPEDEAPPALRDLLAAFQEAVVAQLEDRVERLHERERYPLLTVSGDLAANSLLRERLAAWGTRRGVEVLLDGLDVHVLAG